MAKKVRAGVQRSPKKVRVGLRGRKGVLKGALRGARAQREGRPLKTKGKA